MQGMGLSWVRGDTADIEAHIGVVTTGHTEAFVSDGFVVLLCEAGTARMGYGSHVQALGEGAVGCYEPGCAVRLIRLLSPEVQLMSLFVPVASLAVAWREVTGREQIPSFPPLIVDAAVAGAAFRLKNALTRAVPSATEQQTAWRDLVVRLASRAEPARLEETPADRIVRRVRDYVSEHLADRVTLADLERVTGVSRFHVSRVVHSATGLPPHQYLLRLRLWRARSLIVRGMRPADAALASGFSDQSHFTRWFRRVFGMTPTSFMGAVPRRVAAAPALAARR
jgi:AraC-like DNA-binding protein